VTARSAWARGSDGRRAKVARGKCEHVNAMKDQSERPVRAIRPARAGVAARRVRAVAATVAAALVLAGCGEGGIAGGLRQAGVGGQPDEFLVLPTRPLEMPPDLAALPPPTPGTTARVAYRPQAEAVQALTGRPAPATADAGPLVARVGPADPGIRATLASEDVAFRSENRPRLFERWFSRDAGRAAYSGVILDAEAELRRLRAAGVRTPAAPPLAE
jgi:hypothetical protein